MNQGVELHPEPEGATPGTSAHQHSRLDYLGTDVQARRRGPAASRARTWLIRSAESVGNSLVGQAIRRSAWPSARVPELLSEQARAWAQEGVRTPARATPVRTGRLQRSWQASAGPSGATIDNPTPYGVLVLEGTAAHRIAGTPFLAFVAGGRSVVVRSVEHPGTRSDAELNRAIEQVVAGAAGVGAAPRWCMDDGQLRRRSHACRGDRLAD